MTANLRPRRPALRELPRTGLWWLWASAAVLAVDQASKLVLDGLLRPYDAVPVLPSFNLFLTYNRGIAFSMLEDAGPWVLNSVALVIVAVLLVVLARRSRRELLPCVAIAMIIGGASGNVIDRIVYGYVIDFFQLYYGDWSFAIFNFADSAISIGVALLLLEGVVLGRRRA